MSIRGIGMGAILLVCFLASPLAGEKKALEQSLVSKYELSSVGIDHIRITKPGTLLVIRQGGIYANPSTDYGSMTTKVIDGKVIEPKGFGAAFFAKKTDRALKTGESVYVTRIWVRDKEVRFDVITSDTNETSVRGSSRQIRYAATVAFEFPDGYLENADVDAVKKVVDAILLPQNEVQSANTKTVELGQTAEQVKAALGAPDKIINLGPKTVYVYKDLKVVFMDGKVADVQ
jgi:hypothetical protein